MTGAGCGSTERGTTDDVTPRESRHGAGPLLVVGALGVVFGDIGTSPLYAMRTVLGEGDDLSTTTVYGLTSLVIWALVLVVTVLYVGLLLGVDNEGEGGLLALVALLRRTSAGVRAGAVVSVVGMVGAAMFLGDSVVTPAISVLSAAEGLEVASPSLEPLVLPIALVILLGVFVLQRLGSGRIGKLYGPVMLVWFLVLAAGGVGSLLDDPAAVAAISPHWAVRFVLDDPLAGFLSLGAVILAVTGAEALYADLGHFGRRPITVAWLCLVLPALVLAYLGEAAAVVRDPSAASDPFYAVVPDWATIPVLVVATLATVIASEAVIAGAFTVLHQAAGLGFFPHLRTRHTSTERPGQIYVPAANWALAVAVLGVVLAFRSSEKLAAASGVAVSATILDTVSLYLALDPARTGRVSARLLVGALCFVLMLLFFAASVPKIASGGWLPIGIGIVVFLVMSTWWSGQRRLARARRAEEVSADELLRQARSAPPRRTPADAVFLTEDSSVAPLGLRIMVEGLRVLPERAVLLSWHVEDTPAAPAHETAVAVDTFDGRHEGFLAVDVTLGYLERLEVVHVLEQARRQAPEVLEGLDPDRAYYVVSDAIPRISSRSSMARWRQRLYLLIDRLATDRVEQLRLPRDRSVVMGREFDL